jgi:hypothetical protein
MRGSAEDLSTFVIPDDMKYKQIVMGMPVKRTLNKLNAKTTDISTAGNNKIEFFLTNGCYGDFSRMALDINVEIIVPGPKTYVRLAQGAYSLINRITIKSGELVEDLVDYNLRASVAEELYQHVEVSDTFASMYGYGSQLQRNAWATGVKQYLIPIRSPFLIETGYKPLQYLRERIELVFYLADPTECIETDYVGAAPIVIKITDAEIHYDEVETSPTHDLKVKSLICSTGLNMCAPIDDTSIDYVTGNSYTVKISHKSDAIDYFLLFLRNDTNLRNMAINDRFITWNKYGLETYQLKMNNDFYPVEPINAGVDAKEAYIQALKFLQKWRGNAQVEDPSKLNEDNFNGERFFIVIDVRKYPMDKDLVNPVTTKTLNTNVEIRLRFAQALPAGVRVDIFTGYKTIYEIDTVGKLRRKF